MGEERTAVEPFSLHTDEERIEFFTKHYQYLSGWIQTTKFYPHLISQHVLDQTDKQQIERGHLTNVDRAGALIDLVQHRGHTAFGAFMRILEYDYREQYEHITEQSARPAPPDWRPRVVSMSSEKLADVLSSIERLLQTNQVKTHRFKMIESQLSANDREVTQYIASLQGDLDDTQGRLEKSDAERGQLRGQLQESRQKITQQNNDILHMKRTLNNKKQELRLANGDIAMERTKSARLQKTCGMVYSPDPVTQDIERQKFASQIDALNKEVKAKEDIIDMHKEEIKRINSEMDDLTNELRASREEFLVLEDDYNGDRRKMDQSFERQDTVSCYLRKKYDELKSQSLAAAEKVQQLEADNDTLREENQSLHDHINGSLLN